MPTFPAASSYVSEIHASWQPRMSSLLSLHHPSPLREVEEQAAPDPRISTNITSLQRGTLPCLPHVVFHVVTSAHALRVTCDCTGTRTSDAQMREDVSLFDACVDLITAIQGWLVVLPLLPSTFKMSGRQQEGRISGSHLTNSFFCPL